ncbi:hypothetical protein [Polynucleobacter sp. AM-7D1]|uniref:hypothetical protein n=1 Tax=Polynucleobacter sp. AM-7D1 TaxID=2689102 RepID=UPI001BFE3438|nr:hypothetical protein [Polynucleobacter sp. AM-7D1]QWE28990.1 hypothetical protein GQ359_01540 [Polynucleobacter sp. AM-7D1]
MNSSSTYPYSFIKVKKTIEHIDALYELLKKRVHNISHNSLPTYNDHKNFVKNSPYRVWYLIKVHDGYIGSLYLLNDNCVGIFVDPNYDHAIEYAISWALMSHKPLPEIKSIRSSNFHINVSPSNDRLKKAIQNIGGTKIQTTFSLTIR